MNLFSKELNDFYKDLTYKSLHIDGIEMIGGLVRTPVIEKCITQVCGNNLSKTNLVDECMAIGSALFNSWSNSMKNGVKFPLGQFQNIYGYNSYDILYQYNSEKGEIKKGKQLPFVIKRKDMNNTTNYFNHLPSKNLNELSFYEIKNNNQVIIIKYVFSFKDFELYIDHSGYIRLDISNKIIRESSGVLLNEKDQNSETQNIKIFLFNINRIDQIEGEIQQEKNSLTTKFYENKRLIKNNSLENIRVNSSTENILINEEVKNIEKHFRSLNKIINKDAAKQELIKIKNKMASLGKSVDKAIGKKNLVKSDIPNVPNINTNINYTKFINREGKDDKKKDTFQTNKIADHCKPQINKSNPKKNPNQMDRIREKNERTNYFQKTNNNNILSVYYENYCQNSNNNSLDSGYYEKDYTVNISTHKYFK